MYMWKVGKKLSIKFNTVNNNGYGITIPKLNINTEN